jgi:hypothetical protein
MPDDEDVPEDAVLVNSIVDTYKLNECDFT